MDNSDNGELQEYVKEKLRKLHSHDTRLSGAQVNFKTQTGNTGADKVCEIDLRCYGNPLFISKSAASYEQAAEEAIEELTGKIQQTSKNIPS